MERPIMSSPTRFYVNPINGLSNPQTCDGQTAGRNNGPADKAIIMPPPISLVQDKNKHEQKHPPTYINICWN